MAKKKQPKSILKAGLWEQASISADEQPYEISDNWVWTRLQTLKENALGFFDGDWILSENMDPNGEVRLIQLSDIGIGTFLDKSSKHISLKKYEQLHCTELLQGDILISRMAEPIARSFILPLLPYKCITAVDVAVLRCNPKIIDNRYINYLCNTPWFTNTAFRFARGTTRLRITRNNLGDMAVPLPPLAEQQRIVDRIESLFEKLDQAKELVQSALDTFETRKAAILHQAFTGELTKKWRKDNGVDIDSWEQTTLGQIIKVSSGIGLTAKNMVSEGKIPVYGGNGITGYHNKSNVEKQTIVIGRVGYYCGCVHLIDQSAWVTDNALIVKFEKKRLNTYFLYWLLTHTDLRKNDSSTAQPVISGGKIYQTEIIVPLVSEQEEIVRILDNIFEKEQQAKDLYDMTEKIDLIKKAILARAFRGELGTNDPNEPNSIELLKTVLSDQ